MPLRLRHRYAAGLRDELLAGDIRPTKELPRSRATADAHCYPAHIRQIGAGGSLLRSIMRLIHCRYTYHFRLPDL